MVVPHPMADLANMSLVDETHMDAIRLNILDSEARIAALEAFKTKVVTKPFVTTRVATTTLASDPHLQFAALANARYVVTLRAAIISPAAADFKFDITVPAGATFDDFSYIYPGIQGHGSSTAAAGGSFSTTGVAGDSLMLSGTLVMAGTAGSWSWRWAQFVASGSTSVQPGSSLVVVRES